MRVAVLSLTRDRLEYTRHCFLQLEKLAGCGFDHYVLDQGSQDGTAVWLQSYAPNRHILEPENIGISRGLNKLMASLDGRYEAIVKFDNDCEVTTKNVLYDACRLVVENPNWLVSPRIHGLNSPVGIGEVVTVGDQEVGVTPMIGGIFLAASIAVYDGYQHNEGNPIWGMDDVNICRHIHDRGGRTGYLMAHDAWHYETTKGQEQRYPDYFQRKYAEFQ